MKERIFSIILLCLLFNSTFSVVFAQAPAAAPAETKKLFEEGERCAISKLTPEEAEKIKSLIRKEGITGEKLSSGEKAEKIEQLANNNIVIADKTLEQVAQAKAPDIKLPAKHASWLMNHTIKDAAFAFGIILDDTLRVGRCTETARDNNMCALEAPKTFFRNSGTGLASDFTTAAEAAKAALPWRGKRTDLTPEETQAFIDRFEAEVYADENAVEIQRMRRLKGEVIQNILEGSDFKAKTETNCDNSACTVSVYSLFDRYFNSFFSAEMTLSIVGPTALNTFNKMIGFIKTRGFWPFDLSKIKTLRKMEASLMQPSALFGKVRFKKFKARLDRFPEVKAVHTDLIIGKGGDSGYACIKGGGFQAWLTDAMKPDGLIGKIKDPKVREELVKAIGEMHGYSKTMKNVMNIAEKKYDDAVALAKKQFGEGTPQYVTAESAARVEYGRVAAKVMEDADDIMDLDLPEYFMRKQDWGFPGKGVKNTEAPGKPIQDLYEDSSTFDAHLFNPFAEDGKWTKANTGYEVDGFGNIQLYEMTPKGKEIGRISKEDLDVAIATGKYKRQVAELRDGTFVEISSNTKPLIMKQADQPVPIYDAGWEKAGVLTPEEFSRGITERYARGRLFNSMERNMGQLKQVLIENNYAARRYTSWLDKQYAQTNELLYKYFSSPHATGLKLTALPFVYWWTKRAGVPGYSFEKFSFYRLPKEWTGTEVFTKEEPIYDDAFIDFFANEGADEGDMFIRVINALPWKLVYNKIAEQFQPLRETYEYVTGVGRRYEVQNLLVYLTGPRDCSGCSVTLKGADSEIIAPYFYSPETLTSYIWEETIAGSQKEAEEGQLIVAFTHHTNLSAESPVKTAEAQDIDIAQAVKEKTTCRDAARKLGLGLDVGESVGGIYALSENVIYYFFGWPGLAASIANQILIMPELYGCVDADEGYYVRFFMPSKKKREKVQSTQEVAAEKTANLVSEFKASTDKFLKGAKDSLITKTLEEGKQKLDELAGNTAQPIVQASVTTVAPAHGKMIAPSLFFLWFEPGFEMSKSSYVTEGKMIMEGKDVNGNPASIVLDNEAGKLTVNGKNVISAEQSKDHVRLAALNGKIPAAEIPQALGHILLTGEEELFEVDFKGIAKVLDPVVLDCIKQAVKAQTGLEQKSDDLTESFGRVTSISTNTHPLIQPALAERKWVAEGVPRKVFGEKTKIMVYSNTDVNIHFDDSVFQAGKMESIQFENGSIVYKKETNELIVWLKHHQQGKLLGSEVLGLRAKRATVKNPINDCEEYAVDLSVIGDPESDILTYKAEQFSKSLSHMGPFQTFDTEKQTFLFYTELTPEGECINRFRIIDKETGEVYDSAIDKVEQTPEGLRIFTADGRTHDLGFSYENGKPMLTYNGVPQTLMYAQGRNGGFYYDPEKGMWFAENAQLLPLLEAFKKSGLEFKGNADGTSSATPGTNFMIVDERVRARDFLANLPSLPENGLMLLVFLALMLAGFVLTRKRILELKA